MALSLLAVVATACSSPTKRASDDPGYPTAKRTVAAETWMAAACPQIARVRERAARALSLPPGVKVGTPRQREKVRDLIARQLEATADAFRDADRAVADLGRPRATQGADLAQGLRGGLGDAAARYELAADRVKAITATAELDFERRMAESVQRLDASAQRLDRAVASLRASTGLGPLMVQVKACRTL